MIIFYSGSSGGIAQGKMMAEPELIIRESTIMLSFYLIKHQHYRQDIRIDCIRQQRQKSKRKKRQC